MTREFHYLGPDGEGIEGVPGGIGAAMGSEYCVHLLPSAARMAEAVREAIGKPAPLLLLTPYFRDAELKASLPLFRTIPPGADVEVAVNDLGALQMLRGLFPWMRISIGRLLSGQKKCPRIGVSPLLTGEGRMWHGEGIFSSRHAREYLEETYGIAGYHVDDLSWSRETDVPMRFVHFPYAIVTVSDACPWIGGASSASVGSCPRPCRSCHVVLREPSMGEDLIQRGKSRFACASEDRDLTGAGEIVRYRDLP